MTDTERTTVAAHAGVRLSCLRSGPPGGEPAVLLHGFPENAALGWRRQLPALADAGLRVWAPDQRGYGESGRPSRVSDYVIDALSADALAVLDAAAAEAGRPRAHLVGHDWGGAVAWWTALAHPERLASLTILNCPQLSVLRSALLFRNPRQMARSWYIAWFQLPWLAPAVLGAGRAALLARGLRDSGRRASAGRPAAFDDHDLDAYRAAAARPGALRAMIAWYRALPFGRPVPPGSDGRVRVPVRLIWGARDRALGRELALQSLATCDRGELKLVEEATHWVQHEEPERVNAWIAEWVGRWGTG
jgi:pimeloyl-ACP methyl ester carboxylesterase